MNKFVRSWDKHQERNTYTGPDTIAVDGQKIKIQEDVDMAQRKAPHVEAIMDNPARKADKNVEKSKVVKVLPKNQYASVIRTILQGDIAVAKQYRTSTYANLKRLGIKRDATKAVNKNPRGEGLAASNDIRVWAEKITTADKKAIKQLVAIDATAVSRG